MAHNGNQNEEPGNTLGDQDAPDHTESIDQSTADGTASVKSASDDLQPQEDQGPGDGLRGTLATSTESSGHSQGLGKDGGLLSGGFAVATARHWRVAEMQFEDTARRVRNKQLVHPTSMYRSFDTLRNLFVTTLSVGPRRKGYQERRHGALALHHELTARFRIAPRYSRFPLTGIPRAPQPADVDGRSHPIPSGHVFGIPSATRRQAERRGRLLQLLQLD